MDVRGLGYIGIGVADPDAWRRYAELLGTMVVDGPGDGFVIRIDERPCRVIVDRSDDGEGLAFAGWELADAAAVEVAATELERGGHPVRRATATECAARRVGGYVETTDPGGFVLELFHGPILDHEPFVSATGVSGFVTGAQGMGHIVLGTPASEESVRFYTEVLGFRVSDVWRPGGNDVVFLRCNPRHHSLALVPAADRAFYHFMLEAGSLDDVGAALDRHIDTGTPISMGLGKHTNDRMVSFYSRSPSGFEVEFGTGGLLVDEATWTVTEITKPSFWGHRSPR